MSVLRYLPHVRFFIAWIPVILLGLVLAARYGFANPAWTVLIFVGVFCMAQTQHTLHVTYGASSTLPDYTSDEIEKLQRIGIGFASTSLIIACYFTLVGRPWVLPTVFLGWLMMLAYASPRKKEAYWGGATVLISATTMYVIAGFVTLPTLIIFAGCGFLGTMGLKAYRLITGDYDKIPPNERGLGSFIVCYVLGFSLIAAGLWLL